MKLVEEQIEEIKSADMTEYGFGINQEGLPYILSILRSKIYSNKILAVIREISCNAYDANVEAGKKETPIVITAPTALEPHFKVRDFGNGLSEDQIKRIYTQYGVSTKRNSNSMIGCFGIGRMSGLAYGDSFLVVSYNQGLKSTYTVYLDSTKIGKIAKLSSEPSIEKEGLEVVVPVKKDDIHFFVDEIRSFFRYWSVMPEFLNMEPPVSYKTTLMVSGSNWELLNRTGNDSVAIMGNVAYPFDLKNMPKQVEAFAAKHKISSRDIYFFNTNFVFTFPIGSLNVTASREGLEYDDHTCNSIIEALEIAFSEFPKHIVSKIENAANLWEACLTYQKLTAYGGLIHGYTGLFAKSVKWNGFPVSQIKFDIPNDAATCIGYFQSNRRNTTFKISSYEEDIVVNGSVCLVINDNNSEKLEKRVKSLLYDTFGNYNPKISKVYVITVKDAQKYADFCAQSGFGTVPLLSLSQVPVLVPDKSLASQHARNHNVKHKLSVFKYGFPERRQYPTSQNWEVAEIDSNSEVVYVSIDKFSPDFNFYSRFGLDGMEHACRLAKQAKIEAPLVYGVKEKRLASFKKDCPKAVYLADWLRAKITEQLDDKGTLTRVASYLNYKTNRQSRDLENILKKCGVKKLEQIKCPLVEKFIQNLGYTEQKDLASLIELVEALSLRTVLDAKTKEAKIELYQFGEESAKIYKKFPLLSHLDIPCEESGENVNKFGAAVVKYINSVDTK